MFTILMSIVTIIVIFSLVISIVMIRRQQNKKLDKGMNLTTVKHPIIANPMLIAYVLFPIAIVIGAAIWMYYSK